MAKHFHMHSYRNQVWNLIKSFEAFNIQGIPRNQNTTVHRLAIIRSQFEHVFDLIENNFFSRVIVRLSILDNDLVNSPNNSSLKL